MSPPEPELKSNDSVAARDFAVDVVLRLRHAGFEALWAGGCVRDSLLGRTPKDYDVASSATPDQVINLFGRRRTVPVGVSFGVVMVLGPSRQAGQIEVATFRNDGEYLDGRRPSSVQFCSPAEDARRRDFTINGMFYDPVQDQVIDFVGGREDLAAGIVRAIGNPISRFTEDKLRMLRAVRFAATFGFELDGETGNAVRCLCRLLTQVSVERIAQELRRMLAHFSRERAFRLLHETQLLQVLFPRIFETEHNAEGQGSDHSFERCYQILAKLETDQFEPGLCAILLPLLGDGEHHRLRVARIRQQCMDLKLSGNETVDVTWFADSLTQLRDADRRPLHVLKPILADRRADTLLRLLLAVEVASGVPPVDEQFCRRYLSQITAERLSPEPLIDGRDLHALSLPSGPEFRRMLQRIREEQLDERLQTREQALSRLRELVQQSGTQ